MEISEKKYLKTPTLTIVIILQKQKSDAYKQNNNGEIYRNLRDVCLDYI